MAFQVYLPMNGSSYPLRLGLQSRLRKYTIKSDDYVDIKNTLNPLSRLALWPVSFVGLGIR
jgi:hypothetical protein